MLIINTRDQVVRLKKQQRVGKLTACNGTIAEVSGTEVNADQLDWKTIVIGKIPSEEKNQILQLLREYEDVFAKIPRSQIQSQTLRIKL